LRKIEEGQYLSSLNIGVKHDLWQGCPEFLLLNKSDDSDVVLFGGGEINPYPICLLE
jgi:hypothetical protein